jgi:hypothetical protein
MTLCKTDFISDKVAQNRNFPRAFSENLLYKIFKTVSALIQGHRQREVDTTFT